MKRKVRVTTALTVGFDPTLESAKLPKPSAEAMYACRAWWPYSPVMRESMARVLDQFAAEARKELYESLDHLAASVAEMAGRGIRLSVDVERAIDAAGAAMKKARGETP